MKVTFFAYYYFETTLAIAGQSLLRSFCEIKFKPRNGFRFPVSLVLERTRREFHPKKKIFDSLFIFGILFCVAVRLLSCKRKKALEANERTKERDFSLLCCRSHLNAFMRLHRERRTATQRRYRKENRSKSRASSLRALSSSMIKCFI